jgi:crotonobetainyl-CoA:carnitine CoA-transferase CaiB-like acyl-CoA transferase
VPHPTAGDVSVTGFPWQYSETPAEIRYPPPRLGQHTDEVLAAIGYEPDEIQGLHGAGAV